MFSSWNTRICKHLKFQIFLKYSHDSTEFFKQIFKNCNFKVTHNFKLLFIGSSVLRDPWFWLLTFFKGFVPIQFWFLFISNTELGFNFGLFFGGPILVLVLFKIFKLDWFWFLIKYPQVLISTSKIPEWKMQKNYYNVLKNLNQHQLAYFKTLMYTRVNWPDPRGGLHSFGCPNKTQILSLDTHMTL